MWANTELAPQVLHVWALQSGSDPMKADCAQDVIGNFHETVYSVVFPSKPNVLLQEYVPALQVSYPYLDASCPVF